MVVETRSLQQLYARFFTSAAAAADKKEVKSQLNSY